jgi:hypothetical protein
MTTAKPFKRWIRSGWTHAGTALWVLALATLGFMTWTVTQPGPTLSDTFEGAGVRLAAAQRAVWWDTSCTTLSWRIEGISGVWLDDEPTVGEAEANWCLPDPASYRGFYRDPASPDWRVQVASGEVRHYGLPIYVMQPFILRIVVPMIVAGTGLTLVPLLPQSVRDRFLREQPLAIRVQWRLLVGLIALGGVLVSLGVFAYRALWQPPATYTYRAGNGDLTFTIDPPILLTADRCTTVAWTGTDIASLRVNNEALPPADGEREVCAGQGASLETLAISVETTGGTRYARAIAIPVGSASLWYTALPGLMAGVFFLSPWASATYRPKARILAPFTEHGQLHLALVSVFIGVSLLGAYNIVRHSPWVAYDGKDHFRYVLALSEGRLPTEAESNQFFAPPLAYFVPAATHRLAVWAGLPPCPDFNTNTAACLVTAKAGQLQNLPLLIGTLYLTVLVSRFLAPGRISVVVWALALMGVTSVLYRSFAFNRGEAWTTFLTMYLIHRLLVMFHREGRPRLVDVVAFGVGTGFLVVSRQWGVFAVLGMGLWALVIVAQRRSGPLLRAGLWGYGVAVVTGGWFYLMNALRFGSVTAFNRGQDASKSLEFFIGMGSATLFSEPFRTTRIAQIVPIFYSELWGDFGGFWYVPVLAFDIWTSSAPPQLIDYLARVSVAGLLPTTLLVSGILIGIARLYGWARWGPEDRPRASAGLLACVVLVSAAGYFWFLASYPDVAGDTIKATYMLHALPPIALLAGLGLDWLRRHHGIVHGLITAGMLVVAVHNFPMLVTRYTAWQVW